MNNQGPLAKQHFQGQPPIPQMQPSSDYDELPSASPPAPSSDHLTNCSEAMAKPILARGGSAHGSDAVVEKTGLTVSGGSAGTARANVDILEVASSVVASGSPSAGAQVVATGQTRTLRCRIAMGGPICVRVSRQRGREGSTG
jgi:hypothetical protein